MVRNLSFLESLACVLNGWPHARIRIVSTRSLQSLQSHFLGPHSLKLLLKSLEHFNVFISNGTICQTFQTKNCNEFRSYLLVLTAFLKNGLYSSIVFNIMDGKMRFITSLEKFSFTLYNAIARLWMFSWSILGRWSF